MAVTLDGLSDEELGGELRRRGWGVVPPLPPAAQHKCLVCGKTDEENEDEYGGPLVDVRVIVADGEEGCSDVKRWVCYLHWENVFTELMEMGFESHHHGSTTMLSNEDDPPCGGYGECTLYEAFDGMAEEY